MIQDKPMVTRVKEESTDPNSIRKKYIYDIFNIKLHLSQS